MNGLPGHVQMGDWLNRGGGEEIESMEETDPVEILRTFYLLTPGDVPLIDESRRDGEDTTEGSVYFKCSARLLGKIIRTLEERGCRPGTR